MYVIRGGSYVSYNNLKYNNNEDFIQILFIHNKFIVYCIFINVSNRISKKIMMIKSYVTPSPCISFHDRHIIKHFCFLSWVQIDADADDEL